ncbi:hypothetical protein D3C80_1433150 [compost metagenome]
MGHELENVVALVTDQGQLVEHGLGRRGLTAFDLVLDGLGQRGFDEAFFIIIAIVDFVVLAHGCAPGGGRHSLPCLWRQCRLIDQAHEAGHGVMIGL